MHETESKLTVFFEEPFWVGVYERISDNRLEVCKITFGSEPKDYEVYDFLLRNWNDLRFSPSINAGNTKPACANPKRRQRAIKKQLETHGVGTKSQQALKLQRAKSNTAHKKKSRKEKEDEEQRKFEMQQQKRKEKHKGK